LKVILIRFIRAFLFVYFKTLRVTFHGQQQVEELLKAHGPLIFALWHSKLILLPFFSKIKTGRLFKVAISKSRDGDIPSSLTESYPRFSVVRVAHQARHSALLQLIHELKNGVSIVITPDGPRGPKEKIKPGIYKLQEATGAKIVSFTWNASSSIKLKSWDQFEIPLPFSKVIVRYSLEPFSEASLSYTE
jgi:hypothetical protein